MEFFVVYVYDVVCHHQSHNIWNVNSHYGDASCKFCWTPYYSSHQHFHYCIGYYVFHWIEEEKFVNKLDNTKCEWLFILLILHKGKSIQFLLLLQKRAYISITSIINKKTFYYAATWDIIKYCIHSQFKFKRKVVIFTVSQCYLLEYT